MPQEWTQILSRALDAFRNRAMSDRPLLESNIDCYPEYVNELRRDLSQAQPDHLLYISLIIIHEKQFQEWADRAETLIDSVDAPCTWRYVNICVVQSSDFLSWSQLSRKKSGLVEYGCKSHWSALHDFSLMERNYRLAFADITFMQN
jgi:hypothetical protein